MPDTIYQRSDAVLCFENFKEAALYFDRVLPLNMGRMRGDSDIGDILVGYPEEVPSAALSHLVDGIEGNTKTYSHATRIMEFTSSRWVDFARKVQPYAHLWTAGPGRRDEADKSETLRQYEKLRSSYLANAVVPGHPPIRAIFQEYAHSLGFEEICVSVPATISTQTASADPSLTLSQLKLVDTATADWRQIIELRKDKESHRRLIRLRLFMHSNYSGRTFAFIEDDLARRIHEYQSATRKHGFKTALSSLTVLLNAKDLQASLGAGLVVGLFGGPVAALSAGMAVEVGQIAVHIAERLHEMREWRSGHELAYIIETRAVLSKDSISEA
jgi:hypothetical protein